MASLCPIYSIGCFGHCDDISTGLTALQTGIHTAVYEWNGTQNTYDFFADTGEEIIFCNAPFNEVSCVVFKILQPDGVEFSETIDSVDYNRFQVCRKLKFDRTPLMTNGDLLCDDCEDC